MLDGQQRAGNVTVIYNAGAGLDTSTAQVWSQASTGVPDAPEMGDDFGETLDIGNRGNGGTGDLVIGVTNEDVAPPGETAEVVNAGRVHVLYGKARGLTAADDVVWDVGKPGVPRNLNNLECFGCSLE